MEAFAGFDWDDANRSKCQKHGVPIAEIEAVFQGRFRVAPDTKHSATEDRFIAIGRTETGPAALRGFHDSSKRPTAFHPANQRPLHACQRDPKL